MQRSIAVVLFFGLLVTPAFSQTPTGTITGRVVDKTGAVLPETKVTAINDGTSFKRPIPIHEDGNYSIDLPIGKYRIEAELKGFKKFVLHAVSVKASREVGADLTLEPGDIEDRIEVRADESLLSRDSPAVGTFFSGETIREFPINGHVIDAVTPISPAAVHPVPASHLNMRSGFNALGMDEHSSLYLLDGFDNSDPLLRNWAFRPPIDQVQEFKLLQAGAPPEFGRSAGAVVSVTTKSGTNYWRGSIWEYFRDDDFDARNYFAPANLPEPSLDRNQYGATFSGPLKVNRTFFFLTYEGLRLNQGLSRRATVPTLQMRSGDLSELGAANVPSDELHPLAMEVIQAFPLPNLAGTSGNRAETGNRIENANDYSVKIDHWLLENTWLSGRFSLSVADIVDPFRTETGGGVNLAGFGQTADRTRASAGISAITTFRNLLNEFRVGYTRVQQAVLPVTEGTPGQKSITGFEDTFLNFAISNFDTLGSSQEFRRAVNVYNYIDTISIITGNHQVKAGIDGRRYQVNSYIVAPNAFVFTGLVTGNSMADFLRGLPTLSVSYAGSPGGNARKTEIAWFVQDTWKASRRLTVVYGLRWEYYGRITERTNKQSMWVPECDCIQIAGSELPPQLVDNDFNNFAPRLGLVFRPFGASKTVLKASGGIYYDNDMRHNSEVIMNPPFFQVDQFSSFLIPGLSLDNPFPANSGVASLSPTTFDRSYRDTYAGVWTFGIQHELPTRTLVALTYFGNHVVKARRLRNVNQPVNGVTPHPKFATINAFEQAGGSNFNSLETRVERRFSEMFAFLSSYTWSHAIDNRPGQGGGYYQDNANLGAERADADFDVRHRWTTTLVWALPFGRGRQWGHDWRGVSQALFGGWSLSAIQIAQTGRPLSITLAASPLGTTYRPNSVPGVDWKPADQQPDRWINPAAFSMAAPGTFGDLGRNTARGPGLHNVDLALAKTHYLREEVRLQFRAEVFNVFNHPNFGPPVTQLDRPSFGLISSTVLSERQIQFGVHLDF